MYKLKHSRTVRPLYASPDTKSIHKPTWPPAFPSTYHPPIRIVSHTSVRRTIEVSFLLTTAASRMRDRHAQTYHHLLPQNLHAVKIRYHCHSSVQITRHPSVNRYQVIRSENDLTPGLLMHYRDFMACDVKVQLSTSPVLSLGLGPSHLQCLIIYHPPMSCREDKISPTV